MSQVNIRKYYSTKRKRDVVTGIAIFLFGALIVFQLFITVVFPFQLRHKQLLIAEMEKDEMYEQIDRIRRLVRSSGGRDSGQRGEINLVKAIMDQFALHVRENGNEMTPEQVSELRNVLSRYELIVMTWREKKKDNFHVRQETLDITKNAQTIENSILNSN